MTGNINICLCGDILISRRIPAIMPDYLQEISGIIKQYECCFGNLETTIRRNEGYPEAYPGGTYTSADPLCLHDLKNLGFNLFNTANNHAMDYSHDGLLATLKYLDQEDIPHAGTGENLSEAAAPAFFECRDGRIALIGVTSSFHDSYLAGPQNQEVKGRPGVAPLRHKAVYELNQKNFEDLQRIAEDTGINDYHDQARKEGYLPQSQWLKFGSFDFSPGKNNCVHTEPLAADLTRTINVVSDARLQADVVIVSIHSHQFKNKDKHIPPDFISIFAKECIKAGADIVVCHGPHVMRGIERYDNGIIFHGLGNFMLQLETRRKVGEEEYIKAGITRQDCSGFGGLVKLRSKNGAVGLVADPDAWVSYFVGLSIRNGHKQIVLYPIEISKGYNGGCPKLSNDISILKEVQKMSSSYNTEIIIKEARGYIQW